MERKHRKQLSTEEISYTETLVHSLNSWEIESGLDHAAKRGRRFNSAEVLAALKSGQLIEVNSYGRVLLRSAKGVCVVASLKEQSVITVWFNHPNDNHSTLDLAEYAWKIDAVAYVKALRSGQ